KHMFGAAEADSLSAHLESYFRIVRGIGIGAHADFAHAIGPFHQRGKGLWRRRADESDFSRVHRAIAAIERDPFAFAHHAAACGHALLFGVDLELFGAHDAALSPAARDHRGVARLSARGRED